MRRISFFLGAVAAGLVGCTTVTEQGTLAELDSVAPDVEEVYLEDGLERAAESYRRYLEETPETARTPEAMRRLADLQIEQAYGVMGTGEVVELSAADTAKSKPVRAAPDMAPPEAADMPAPVSAAPLQRADSGTARMTTSSRARAVKRSRSVLARLSKRIARFSRPTRTTSATTRCSTRCRGPTTRSASLTRQ
jgi:hypothetical protein